MSRLEEKIDDYLKFGAATSGRSIREKKSAWSYTREGKREAVCVLVTNEPRIEPPILDLFAELSEEIETA